MSFAVRFWTFAKKDNSTARPSGSYTEYQCRIKAPSGMLHPVIEISATSNYPNNYNYAYIPDFGRYYFVREWTLEPGNLWTASMDVDALASWKTTIGAQSFYVLRSSAEKDGLIKDTMYPSRATYEYAITAGSAGPWWTFSTGIESLVNGYYVIGLLSYTGNVDRLGGVNYIAMIPAQFLSFLSKIYSPSDTAAYMAITGDAIQAIFTQTTLDATQKANLAYIVENPFLDYIKSITWVPNAPVVGSAISSGLYLGPNLLTGFDYYNVAVKEHVTYTSRISIAKHPLTNTRGGYLNTEPFTEHYLKLPKMGLQPVPADLLADKSYLWVSLQIDPITGEGLYTLLVSNTDGIINAIEVSRWYSPVGVEIQLSQTKDVGEKAQAVLNLAGLALNSLTNPGSITQLPAAIGDIVKSRNTNGQTIGRSGGWLGLTSSQDNQPRLISIFHDVADDDNTHNGRPLCKVRTPASLGGYMMIQDADVSIAGTAEEIQAIKETMESGFYYE